MKKTLSLLLTIISLLSFSACSDNGRSEISTGLKQHYQNNDLYFDYTTRDYNFRLPKYWEGRYIVEVSENSEKFYEINSYNKNETGLLFTIKQYEDNSYTKLKNYKILGKNAKTSYILELDENEIFEAEFEEDFKSLKKGISVIISTFNY